MAPVSNPTRRVVAIVDLLTLHPEGFTLAQITNRLELSKSTCLAILTELTAASYVSHDGATRRYRLGSALVAVAETVSQLLPGIPRIRDALHDLSEELGVVCGANVLAGEDLVVVLRIGPPDPLDTAPVGQRVPFVPPYGFSFVAWSDRATFASWLQRAPIQVDEMMLDRLERSVAAARHRGFAVLHERPTTRSRQLAAEMRLLRENPSHQAQFKDSVAELLRHGFHLDVIDPDQSYRFMSIHAPLRMSGPRVLLSPHILGTAMEVSGDTIIHYGKRLARVAESLPSPQF